MGRTISANLTSILARPARDIQWTVKIFFPTIATLKFATAPLTIGADTFTNDVEGISEIRQTLEAPVDRVGVTLQNKDRILGQHLLVNFAEWRKAEAMISRYYRDVEGLGLNESIEIFRGAIQQPVPSDLTFEFDVLDDRTSPGEIVSQRNEGGPCPFVFKDARTCAYTGSETTCDHNLRAKTGCLGRANTHHFGGFQHFYNPDANIPGTGGNTGGGGSGGGSGCPRLDQYVWVRGSNDRPTPIRVNQFTLDHELWHPIDGTFHRTTVARVVRDVPIWELFATNGAGVYSSHYHLVLPHRGHKTGRRIDAWQPKDEVVTVVGLQLDDSQSMISRDTGERGDVMYIVMTDGKIYAAGDSPDKAIIAHNNKPGGILL